MAEYKNAAPMVVDYGIRDSSAKVVPAGPLELPQHLPVHHIWASRGKVGSNFFEAGSGSIEREYGTETFRIGSKFHNRSIEFLRRTVARANNCVVRRVVPEDINDVANVTLYLDVLETKVPVYEKDPIDGSIVLDSTGEPVPVKEGDEPVTVAGYKVFWVADVQENKLGDYIPKSGKSRKGLQEEDGVQSTQYPIYEFSAATPGSDGNLTGIKLWPALQTDVEPFPSHLLEDGDQYPLYFAVVEMLDPATASEEEVLNVLGSNKITVTTKPGGINPATDSVADLATIAKNMYIKEGNSQLGGLYIYEKNLEEVLKKFAASEVLVEDDFRDPELKDDEDGIYAFNIAGFTNSNGSPYQTVQVIEHDDAVRLTRNSTIYLGGGSDGTMDDETFDRLVREDLKSYGNPLHQYNDLVLHPESIIYDVGYSLETKRSLCNFISLRKDTFIVFSSYIQNQHLSIEEQHSLGVAIKAMVELYPESSYWGTATARAAILMGTGTIVGSNYAGRVPTSYDLLDKAAAFMGAANGNWVEGRMFDRAPNNVINTLTDIDIEFVPASTRTIFWASGLNFPLNYKTDRKFFPALKTVYDNDTSILTSFFNVMAACYLNKIGHHVWRQFTGVSSLTPAELERDINSELLTEVEGRFNGVITVIPDAKVTELDDLRGYSWTLNIRMGGNNMRTVQALTVDAYRKQDLDA